MHKTLKMTVTAAAVGFAAVSPIAPAHGGSAVGAGLVGFGIGAIIGSTLAPPDVYFIPPPPPEYYGPEGYYAPEDYGPPYWYGHRAYPRPRPPAQAAAHPARSQPAHAPSKAGPSASTAAQKSEAKFQAAQAKARRLGVAALNQDDIDGLSPEQIKRLRGY